MTVLPLKYQYEDGTPPKIGDRVRIYGDTEATVKCSIDNAEYSPEFPEDQWSYLQSGLMVENDQIGLMHFKRETGDEEIFGRPLIEII